MYCTNCGVKILETANFCGRCGSPTESLDRIRSDIKETHPPAEDGHAPSTAQAKVPDKEATVDKSSKGPVVDQLGSVPPTARTAANNDRELDTTAVGSEGIGRVAYLGLMVGLIVLSLLLGAAASSDETLLVTQFAAIAVSLLIAGSRFQNIGYNPLWVVLSLIPLVNLVIGYLCLSCPPGYAVHKKLDTPGKIVATIFAVLIGLIVLSIAVALLDP